MRRKKRSHFERKELRRRCYSTRRWKSVRIEALKRAGFRCDQCGKTRADLQVHHVKEVEADSTDSELFPPLEGLSVLCPKCHSEQHWEEGPSTDRLEWLRYLNKSVLHSEV